MTVRWTLTYRVDKVDVLAFGNKDRPNTEIIEPSDVAHFNLTFFHTMRYSFKAPTRAFKTLVEFLARRTWWSTITPPMAISCLNMALSR
jgi:hypothetical protein